MSSEREQEQELVARARAGDKVALGELVRGAQQLVYKLAIRMVADPIEAQDLTQEVLIRVVTGLAKFRGDSSFKTWVYRVASNHLLTARKRLIEQKVESFDTMAAWLAEGVEQSVAADEAPIEDQILIKEAKLLCTSRMLLGLDRDHRLAFILGEIFELSGEEGAEILEIEPAAFRKRLSRARERMTEFATGNCGLVDPGRGCRCGTQAARMVRLGAMDPKRLCWTSHPAGPASSRPPQREDIEGVERTIELFRSHPDYAAPEALADGLRQLIESDTTGLWS